ncbi:zinc finger protein 277 isoform X2 [Copidosoma floridanum]|uniref:zinc finger protein 277 isoform X2 n=1 Tax=Copidosoma floridanum TaxID=29053 RepID=UPI000C6F8F74|nr:zinc finger protein 277 isoform X2 [Copidosoma floridanum]
MSVANMPPEYGKSQFYDINDEPCDVACLLCESSFILPTDENDFLLHLFNEHRLVIGDVDKIASLKSYVRYWKIKFKGQLLTTYCTTFYMDKKDVTPKNTTNQDEFYFLLSDCLMEDKTLRYELKQAKLEWVLAQQVQERSDTTFKRGCMFCRTEFSGSRIEYVTHLYQKHNILLGKPENLVFIDEYLDRIENNIENFICIYCEKTFKNRPVLKEHMRKKLHKQVNPNNKTYDKYYVSNYSLDVTHKVKRKPTRPTENSSAFSSENEDEDWSDWNNESIDINCLFCTQSWHGFSELLEHMIDQHKFDFIDISAQFTFYQKVKMVNYIRKQVHANRCIYCDTKAEDINLHMGNENHYKLPAIETWDQPEFYFPMFESDSFLYNLDTDDSDSDN